MQKLAQLTTVTLSLFAHPCAAEPMTLTCKYLDGTRGGGRAASVNQAIIDSAEPSIEFRAAETIGTTTPLNYSFDNRPGDALNRLGDVLIVQDQPDAVVAGGVRFGAPFAIRLDRKTKVLVWQYIDGSIPEYSRFACRP